MKIPNIRTSLNSLAMLLTMCISMVLSGCLQLGATAPTTPSNQQTDSASASQCGIYNPNEMVMCTMEFEPVCLKEKDASGHITYRTAGNSCSACNTLEAVSYTPGECNN